MTRISEYGSYFLEKVWEYLKFSFLVLGTIYTGYTIWIAAVPSMSYVTIQKKIGIQTMIPKWEAVLFIILGSILFKLVSEVRFRNLNTFHLRDSELTIAIRCGDILKTLTKHARTDGTILVGMNTMLKVGWHDDAKDTLINQIKKETPDIENCIKNVAKKSTIRRKMGKDVYGSTGQIPSYRESVEMDSSSKQSAVVCEELYSIGDYFHIHRDNKNIKQDYIFLVISDFLGNSDAPVTDRMALDKAYRNLFSREKNLGCIGSTLYVPLLGKNCGMGATHSSEELMLIAARNFIKYADKVGFEKLVFMIRPKTFRKLPVEELYLKFKIIEEMCPKCHGVETDG